MVQSGGFGIVVSLIKVFTHRILWTIGGGLRGFAKHANLCKHSPRVFYGQKPLLLYLQTVVGGRWGSCEPKGSQRQNSVDNW
jgi:hypothetical protein